MSIVYKKILLQKRPVLFLYSYGKPEDLIITKITLHSILDM